MKSNALPWYWLRAGLGDKRNDAAAGPAEFGFETVGLDGELRDGVERGSVHRGPKRGARAIGIARSAVQHDAESALLSAADAEVLVAAVDAGRDAGQVEGTSHVAAHDGGQAFDQAVGNRVQHLRVVGLQLTAVSRNLDGLLDGAYLEFGVEPRRATRLDRHIVVDGSPEAFDLDDNPIGAHWQRDEVKLARGIRGRLRWVLVS